MSQSVFDIKSINILRETAQALQEAKKMARSIENVCSSLRPLASQDIVPRLDAVEEKAMEIAREFGRLYNLIAKEAFGGDGAN